jgi:hypothetical protein
MATITEVSEELGTSSFTVGIHFNTEKVSIFAVQNL